MIFRLILLIPLCSFVFSHKSCDNHCYKSHVNCRIKCPFPAIGHSSCLEQCTDMIVNCRKYCTEIDKSVMTDDQMAIVHKRVSAARYCKFPEIRSVSLHGAGNVDCSLVETCAEATAECKKACAEENLSSMQNASIPAVENRYLRCVHQCIGYRSACLATGATSDEVPRSLYHGLGVSAESNQRCPQFATNDGNVQCPDKSTTRVINQGMWDPDQYGNECCIANKSYGMIFMCCSMQYPPPWVEDYTMKSV